MYARAVGCAMPHPRSTVDLSEHRLRADGEVPVLVAVDDVAAELPLVHTERCRRRPLHLHVARRDAKFERLDRHVEAAPVEPDVDHTAAVENCISCRHVELLSRYTANADG